MHLQTSFCIWPVIAKEPKYREKLWMGFTYFWFARDILSSKDIKQQISSERWGKDSVNDVWD